MINNNTGEIIKTGFSTIPRKSVSVQSVGTSKVEVYEFVNTYEAGPSGSKEDYRVVKKPKLVETYDIKKVIQERCKGCDLKSIVARIDKTGDISLLNQRNVSYGSEKDMPKNLSDALELGKKTSHFLDGLTHTQKELYVKLAKDPKAFADYIKTQEEKNKTQQPAAEVNPAEKGE